MVVKHKIFKIRVVGEDYDFEDATIKQIDDFLANPNFIYVSHSVTSLGKDTSMSSGRFREQFFVISMVYKDLTATAYALDKVSEKTQKVVRKTIEIGGDIEPPKHQTKFEKKIQENKEQTKS